jgi:DNA-binding CsgD family transcriptional regulator
MKTGQTPEVGRREEHEGPQCGIVRIACRATIDPSDSITFLPDTELGVDPCRGLLQVCMAVLNAVRSPLCIVAPNGRAVLANRAGEEVLSHGRWVRLQRGCVVSTQPHTSEISLPVALERLGGGLESTVLLTDHEAAQQAILSVAPVSRDAALCPPSRPTILGLLWLVTTEPDATPVKQVGQLFCLTPAEQTLLARLVAGEGLREAAEGLCVSIHTARNQLKAILRKTGRHTQAQLLTLVSRVSSLRIEES